jgi:hypothetical protein
MLCALILMAPVGASASVGKQSYEGPVATDGVQGRSPMVRLKVEFKKVDGKRGAPKQLIIFDHRAIALYCQNGQKTYAGPSTVLDGGPGGYAFVENTGQKVKKGKFKVNESNPIGETADIQQITGRVGRKGNATGTIHLVLFHPSYGTCDSGVVKWTAAPVAKFSPVTQPPCAFQGTCPP